MEKWLISSKGLKKVVIYIVGGLVLFRLRVEMQRQLLNSRPICVIADHKGPEKTIRKGGLEASIHENVVSCPGKQILLVAGGP